MYSWFSSVAVQAVSVSRRQRKGGRADGCSVTAPAQHEVLARDGGCRKQRDACAHSHQAGGVKGPAKRVQSSGARAVSFRHRSSKRIAATSRCTFHFHCVTAGVGGRGGDRGWVVGMGWSGRDGARS